jgi:ubiquinone/menaquinone biosynthesis C-methylase UbiE
MKNILDIILVRDNHVCPWWCCFTFDNIFRRLAQNPDKIMKSYINPGDKILDIGPGQGYFTIPMARMAGESGKVTAIDIQKKMLEFLMIKAEKNKLSERIIPKLIEKEKFEIEEKADFALAFWMVHEVPDKKTFFESIYNSLKPGKCLLIAEPFGHVTKKKFDETISITEKAGFSVTGNPDIFFSRAVLLIKK